MSHSLSCKANYQYLNVPFVWCIEGVFPRAIANVRFSSDERFASVFWNEVKMMLTEKLCSFKRFWTVAPAPAPADSWWATVCQLILAAEHIPAKKPWVLKVCCISLCEIASPPWGRKTPPVLSSVPFVTNLTSVRDNSSGNVVLTLNRYLPYSKLFHLLTLLGT